MSPLELVGACAFAKRSDDAPTAPKSYSGDHLFALTRLAGLVLSAQRNVAAPLDPRLRRLRHRAIFSLYCACLDLNLKSEATRLVGLLPSESARPAAVPEPSSLQPAA